MTTEVKMADSNARWTFQFMSYLALIYHVR